MANSGGNPKKDGSKDELAAQEELRREQERKETTQSQQRATQHPVNTNGEAPNQNRQSGHHR